jgi:hypothetical protein
VSWAGDEAGTDGVLSKDIDGGAPLLEARSVLDVVEAAAAATGDPTWDPNMTEAFDVERLSSRWLLSGDDAALPDTRDARDPPPPMLVAGECEPLD